MRASPVALHLEDFATRSDEVAIDELPMSPIFSPVDAGDERKSVRDEAWKEGFEAAESEFAARMVGNDARIEGLISVAREAWVQTEADVFRDSLSTGLADIEERVSRTVSGVLVNFLVSSQERRAVSSFVGNLKSFLTSDALLSVQICGPADMLHAISDRLQDFGERIEMVQSEGIDVSATVGDTLLETKLQTWLNDFQMALEAN